MENLEKISTPMSLTEIAVRATYQIVVTDTKNEPVGMGSGCCLYYKKRLFFLTVAHVTDEKDVSVTVETNKAPVNGQTPNYCVGGMNYFDLFDAQELEKLKNDKDYKFDRLNKIETLDFAFAELTEVIEVLQKEIDFKHHGLVPASTKIVIPESGLDSIPDSNEPILFYGTINGKFENGILERQPKLTVDCEFLGEHDRFYKIKLPNVIVNSSEYEGTSGAPVFDTTGNFLGLISYGFEGLPFIFAFKNTEIKKLLDFYITANPQQ
jgi:hypothetical protein